MRVTRKNPQIQRLHLQYIQVPFDNTLSRNFRKRSLDYGSFQIYQRDGRKDKNISLVKKKNFFYKKKLITKFLNLLSGFETSLWFKTSSES